MISETGSNDSMRPESAASAPTENARGMLVGGLWPMITTGCSVGRIGG
jgi:hypothetical protein